MNVLEIKGLALSLSQMSKPTLEEMNKLLDQTGNVIIPVQVKEGERCLKITNGGKALLKAKELWESENFTARSILRGIGFNIPMIGMPGAAFIESDEAISCKLVSSRHYEENIYG